MFDSKSSSLTLADALLDSNIVNMTSPFIMVDTEPVFMFSILLSNLFYYVSFSRFELFYRAVSCDYE